MGWHKVGWISCFLLVALFRMAVIFFNPSDTRHQEFMAPLAYRAMGLFQGVWATITQYFVVLVYEVLCFILYQVFILWRKFLPLMNFKKSLESTGVYDIKHVRIPVYSLWVGATWERLIRVVKDC